MARRWPVVAAVVLVAAAGAGVAAALSFDPASQRDRIVQAVRRATGRELTIAGPMRVGWGLTPVLEAEDVSLANQAGGSRPQMVTVARVEARVRLLALLAGRLEIASVTLVRPDILLETDADGRGNWQFERPVVAAGPASTSSPGPRLTTQLDSLRVEAGRVAWRDGSAGRSDNAGRSGVADVPVATVELADGPAHVLAQAVVLGTEVRLDATLGTWAQLTAAGAWPVRLAGSAGDATVSLDGLADPAARRVSGRVEAAVPDLARLGALLGRPGLPALRDVHLAGTLLPAGGLPQDVSVQVGPSDLGQMLPGATLGRLSLTWPAGQAARLEAEGGIGGGPWHVASGMQLVGQAVALRAFSVASPLGNAAGDLRVQSSPRFSLGGTLVATRVDVDAIRTAARPDAAPVQGAPGPAPGPMPGPVGPSVPGRLFTDVKLPWATLRRGDADLQLTAAVVRWGGVDYRNAAGHLAVADGVARVDAASIVTPAGRVDFSASADARAAAPPVALVLRSPAMSLDAVMQAVGLPGGAGAGAVAEVDVALHAAGASPHALASTVTGHAGIAVVDGEIADAALAGLVGDLARQVDGGAGPGGRGGLVSGNAGGRVHVRCLALRANADAGVVTLAALRLDTPRLELEGGGTLNLGDETLALHLRPVLRLGGAGVSTPIRLEGGLRRPAVGLDPVAGRTGVTIGGLTGPADDCAAELMAARDGRAGVLPGPAAGAKAPKPADLLRSLLR